MRSLLVALTLVAAPAFAQSEREIWGLVREYEDIMGNRDGIWENEHREAGERGWLPAMKEMPTPSFRLAFAEWKESQLRKHGVTKVGHANEPVAEGHALLSMARYGRSAGEFDDFVLGSGATAIYGQRWDAKGEQKVVTVIVPGYTESTLDWTHVANSLNEQGSRVYVFDPPGQGLSAGPRGDVANYREWTSAYRKVLAKAQAENPGSKVIVMAHSTGGGIVMDEAHDRVNGHVHTKGPDGYVLSAPYLELSSNAINRVSGIFSRVPLLNTVPIDPFLVKLSDDEVLSPRLKQFQKATGAKNTLHFIRKMSEMTDRHVKWLEEPSTRLTMPIAVVHSEHDNVTNPEMSRRLVERSGDATLRIREESSNHDLQWDRRGIPLLLESWSEVAGKLSGSNVSRDASTTPTGGASSAGGAAGAGIARD